ncbi:hypothetical protein BH11PLA2_BH11PLA2_51740 [soil metagenome]
MFRQLFAIMALFTVTSPAWSADKEELVKQKATAEENWKKLGDAKKAIHETNDLLIYTNLPEAKAKTLGEAAQKTVAAAREALGFAKDETLFPGKLTVYIFADFADLKNFIRKIELRRPEANTNFTQSLRGDTPFIALSPASGAKVNDTELSAEVATWTGAAVLNKKLGIGPNGNIPEWLQKGFGKAASVRGDKSESRVATHRAKVKAVVLANGGKSVWAKDVWSGTVVKDADLAAASLVEYLAFGPGQEKFLAFCKVLRPGGDDAPAPTIEDALKAAEWSMEGVDTGWKTWVQKGK